MNYVIVWAYWLVCVTLKQCYCARIDLMMFCLGNTYDIQSFTAAWTSWMGIVKILFGSLYSSLQICGQLRQTTPAPIQKWRRSFVCDSLYPIQERLTAGFWDVWRSFRVCDSLIRWLMHWIGSVSSKISRAVGFFPLLCRLLVFKTLVKQIAREVILKGQLDYQL